MLTYGTNSRTESSLTAKSFFTSVNQTESQDGDDEEDLDTVYVSDYQARLSHLVL